MSDEKELLIFLLEKALDEVRRLTEHSSSHRCKCCCHCKEHKQSDMYEDMYKAWIENQGCKAKI
jgi:hypothetical protein